MKATFTLTVVRECNILPDGGTEHESDASAVAAACEEWKQSILDDPFAFIDSKDAKSTVTVEI